MGVGTLVSSQERRTLAVPLIKRLSTADEPVVNRGFCSPVGFKYELDCSCFRGVVQDSCLRYLVCTRDRCLLGEPYRRRLFRPGHAPLRPDLLRPARGMSGFWTLQVGLHKISLVRASGGSFRRLVFDACLLGELLCRHLVLPDPAQPPHRALRTVPPVVCLGFRFDKSKTQTNHERFGAGRRTAVRQGGVGRGRTGRQQVGPPRWQPSLLPSRAS